LQRALGFPTPAYFHCDLVTDAGGARLAKRRAALSLRALRERGHTPADARAMLDAPPANFDAPAGQAARG